VISLKAGDISVEGETALYSYRGKGGKVGRRELPRPDSGPAGRQAIATAIFARTDVLGFERMEYELTSDAIELGLDAALPAVHELQSKIGEFGRGERRQATLRHLNVPANLLLEIEVTGTERWLTRSTA
jgi:hypothetical protein